MISTSQTTPSSLERKAQIALSFTGAKLGLLFIRHPILVVQTCKQATPNLANLQILHTIYDTDGLRGFYKGISSSVMKICMTESYRGVLMMEVPKQVRSHLFEPYTQLFPIATTIATSLISTLLISLFDAFLVCPFSSISTLQITADRPPSLGSLLKRHAITTLYRGYTPLFVQTALLWGNFLIVDDFLKHLLNRYCNGISYPGLACTAVIGGCLQACFNVIPDTIRVNMQKATHQNLTMRATTRLFIQTYGVRSLFYALPHRLASGIIAYSYKSMLRHFWMTHDNPSELPQKPPVAR